MSDVYGHIQTIEKSLAKIAENQQRDKFVCLPAVVESYDPETKTVSAVPVLTEFRETDAGDTDELGWTPIEDIPVIFPGGGPVTITWPIPQGTPVLLLFCSRDIGEWLFSNGKEPIAPENTEQSPEGSVFCLPRVYPGKANPGKANESDLIIEHSEGPTEIHVTAKGEVQILAGKVRLGSLDASKALAVAEKVNDRFSAAEGKINELVTGANAAVGVGGFWLTPQTPLGPQSSTESTTVFTNG